MVPSRVSAAIVAIVSVDLVLGLMWLVMLLFSSDEVGCHCDHLILVFAGGHHHASCWVSAIECDR